MDDVIINLQSLNTHFKTNNNSHFKTKNSQKGEYYEGRIVIDKAYISDNDDDDEDEDKDEDADEDEDYEEDKEEEEEDTNQSFLCFRVSHVLVILIGVIINKTFRDQRFILRSFDHITKR